MGTKTIRQAVFDDDYIQELVAGLEQMPDRIRTAKRAIIENETRLKYNTAVADAKQAVSDYEVEAAYEVKNDEWIATDADLPDPKKIGKSRFANEEKRKTETRRRLVKDEHYADHCNAVADALSAEATMKMDLGKAYAQFAAIEAEFKGKLAIANMIAGLAHESTTQERTYRHVTTVQLGENNHV